MWWLLLGCPFVGVDDYKELQDTDADGVRDGRFDGRDCDPTNPAVGDCDADADGARRPPFGDDCDDEDPAVHPEALELCNGKDDDCDGRIDDAASVPPDRLEVFWLDGDADGFGDEPLLACELPAGAAVVAGDCDDTDDTVHPDADELCDPVDQDCDGDPTTNAIDRVGWFTDDDGDGFGTGVVVATSCEPPEGTGPTGDCDDTSALVNPGAQERCNGLDDDCDGAIDDNDGDVVVSRIWTLDRDGDTYGAPGTEIGSCADPSGEQLTYILNAPVDCDDQDDTVQRDRVWWPDLDQDGFGDTNGHPTTSCLPPPLHAAAPGDCDDTDIAVNPAGQEICNGVDDDCDTLVDNGTTGQAWFRDEDGDGYGDYYGDSPPPPVFACAPPQDGPYAALPGDCDDHDATVNPIAVERCGNDVDDDCDGAVDALDTSVVTERFYLDADGDGFGRDDVSTVSCGAPDGFALQRGDCNDNDATVHRSLTLFPSAGESTSLQTIVDETCHAGTVLITGDVLLSALTLPDRHIQLRGFADERPTIRFDPLLITDPAFPSGSYLFSVPAGGRLTLDDLDFRGTLDLAFEARGLISVIGGGEVEITDVDIEQVEFRATMILQGSATDVQVRRVQHTDLRAGNRGLYWVQSRARLTIEDSDFSGVDTRLPNPDDDPVLLYSTLPDSILLDDVTIDASALTPGTTLMRLNRQPLAPTQLHDVTITNSGRVMTAREHTVEIVRNRWVDVGAFNTFVPTPPPDPNGPWACTRDAAVDSLERDLLILDDDAQLDIRNTEIIGSGALCIESPTATVSIDQSAIAVPEQGIARGVHIGQCPLGGDVLLPVALTNSLVVQEDASVPLFQSTTGVHAAIHTLDNVSTTHAATLPATTTLCVDPVVAGNAAERTLDEMQLVSPRSTLHTVAPADWLLHAFLETCEPAPLSDVASAEQGPSFGTDADPRWWLDADGDQAADGWERFWFGDTASCSESDAYWAGDVPSTFSPPACSPATVVQCPPAP